MLLHHSTTQPCNYRRQRVSYAYKAVIKALATFHVLLMACLAVLLLLTGHSTAA